ncbi:transposase [Thiocystis violascens DSM 198]|uniref:Transposase n=2 Tax=Thiocystis violascens TaxID=73141 RepID=I3Y5S3_THIV6|nr:transposase [Thiocystis violascens DSM 198]AFL76110.1 transposase [Thiocystis violascens DSM 198]
MYTSLQLSWCALMSKAGRPPKIHEAEQAVLRQIVTDRPTSTLSEIARELAARTGIEAHEATIRKSLREAGVTRLRGESGLEAQARATPRRYGYTDAHRRHDPDQSYPSCLTDAEWDLVAALFEMPGGRGQPPRVSRRSILEACCYVVRTGCAWRMLPHDFAPWQNVYKTFRRWSAAGKFEQMHDRLRGQWREREGREIAPTAAVLDAQSTRGSPQGGPSGFDAGKQVKGRKRSLVVDTLGFVLAVSVVAANLQDRDAASGAVADTAAKYPQINTLFVDSAYAGQFAQTTEQTHAIRVEVVRHPANKSVGSWHVDGAPDRVVIANADGFVPLPKRWVVERTHAWNERARRLIMHHDRLPAVSETWVWLAEARILLRRLTTTV